MNRKKLKIEISKIIHPFTQQRVRAMRKIYYLKPKIQNAFTSFFTILTAVEIILFGILLYMVDRLNIQRSNDMIFLHSLYHFYFLIVLFIQRGKFSGFGFCAYLIGLADRS